MVGWLEGWSEVGVFGDGVEAWALLDVFGGFYCAVMVEVGAEVAMAEYARAGIGVPEGGEQGTEGGALLGGAGVGGDALGVESAFVGYADAVGVVAAGVGAGGVEGAHGVDCAVFPYVVVIATTAGEAAEVFALEGGGGEIGGAAGGGAVDYN